jgi:hypothetical protein
VKLAVRLVAAAVALGLAVGALLLAQDVRSWRDTVRGDAIRYAVSPTADQQWTAPTYLPASVSGRLLGVGRDRHRLSALRFFALAEAIDLSQGLDPSVTRLLDTTERSLAALSQDKDPARAAQAFQLLGAILFLDAKVNFIENLATYTASVSAMQNAVRADPGNQRAAANLELMLRQFEADAGGGQQRRANNQGSKAQGKTVGRGEGVPPLNSPTGNY